MMSAVATWMSRNIKEVIVYRSVSNDVYLNLALEDWIFHNIDVKCRRILLLWRNEPCVVIGRHQNPWVESHLNKLKQNGIKLARRKSGGGTVYHDMGNLNCTLFTNREDYQRTRNLQLACDAINNLRRHGFNLRPSERGDILTADGKKVSGSAAKLAKETCYHHFTVLIDTNRANLKGFLKHDPNLNFPLSRATASVPSPTTNLKELLAVTDGGTDGEDIFPSSPHLSYDTVCTAIAREFYQSHSSLAQHNEIHSIDPTSTYTFPGIDKLRIELTSDEWIYNRTPSFTVMDNKLNNTLTVTKGIITTISPHQQHLIGTTFLKYLQSN